MKDACENLISPPEKQSDDYTYSQHLFRMCTALAVLIEADEISNPQEFVKVFKQLDSNSEERMITITELFKQEGKDESFREIAIKMIKEEESLTRISKYTGLSFKSIRKLKSQRDQIDRKKVKQIKRLSSIIKPNFNG